MEIKEQELRTFTITYAGQEADVVIRPPNAADAMSYIMFGEAMSFLSGKNKLGRLCVDMIVSWPFTDESGEAWPITYESLEQLPLTLFAQITEHVAGLIAEAWPPKKGVENV